MKSRGLLFCVLALGLAVLAAVAAAVLAVWMADLARRELRAR